MQYRMRRTLTAIGLASMIAAASIPAFAQDDTTPTPFQRGRMWGMHGPGGIAQVLEDAGLDQDAVWQALQSGKSLTEILTEAGVDVEALKAEIIAGRTADIAARVEQMFNHTPANYAGRLEVPLELMANLQEATGLTAADLIAGMRDGKTVGEIVTEAGLDPATVIEQLVASARETLNAQVEAGTLTAEQLELHLTNFEARLNSLFAGDFAGMRGGLMGGMMQRGMHGGMHEGMFPGGMRGMGRGGRN